MSCEKDSLFLSMQFHPVLHNHGISNINDGRLGGRVVPNVRQLLERKRNREPQITCPNCDFCGDVEDFNTDTGRGDITCGQCGCVLDNVIDGGAERASFYGKTDHSRTRLVDAYTGMDLHVQITQKKGKPNTLQQAQNRLEPAETSKALKKSNIFAALQRTFEGKSQYFKGADFQTAKYLINELMKRVEGKNTRINGMTSDGFCLAALYLASLYNQRCVPLADLHGKDATLKKEVLKHQKNIQKHLPDISFSCPTAKNFVDSIAHYFQLDFKVTGKAITIIDNFNSHKCSEKCNKMSQPRPSSIAAAAFFKASTLLQEELKFDPLNPENVAVTVGIEVPTLMNAVSLIEDHGLADN